MHATFMYVIQSIYACNIVCNLILYMYVCMYVIPDYIAL